MVYNPQNQFYNLQFCPQFSLITHNIYITYNIYIFTIYFTFQKKTILKIEKKNKYKNNNNNNSENSFKMKSKDF